MEVLLVFRRTLYVITSWLDVHFVKDWLVSPWLYAAFSDPRRPHAEKVLMAPHLYNLSEEQQDEWFGGVLVKLLKSAADLYSPPVVKALYHWSWEVLGTACQGEFIHGRNRRRCHQNMTWPTFAAIGWNGEAAQRLGWQVLAHKKSGSSVDVPEPPAKQDRTKRALTIRDIARNEIITARKELKQPIHVTSAEFISELKTLVERVEASPDLQASYEQQVSLANLQRDADVLAIADAPSNSTSSSSATAACKACPVTRRAKRAAIADDGGGGGSANAVKDLSWVIDVDKTGAIVRKMPAPTASNAKSYPVSTELMEARLVPRYVGGVKTETDTLASLGKQFNERVMSYATACKTKPVSNRRIPRWSASPGVTRATPDGKKKERAVLEGYIQQFFEDACKPRKLALIFEDHIVAKCENDLGEIVWVVCMSANARAGAIKLRLNLAELVVVESSEEGEPRLLEFRRHVRSETRPLPFAAAVDSGMFWHMSHHDLAVRMLGAGPTFATKAKLVRMVQTAARGDAFVLHGADVDCPHVEVDLAEGDVAGSGGDPGEGHDDTVDWEHGVLPTVFRRRGNVAARDGVADEATICIDAIEEGAASIADSCLPPEVRELVYNPADADETSGSDASSVAGSEADGDEGDGGHHHNDDDGDVPALSIATVARLPIAACPDIRPILVELGAFEQNHRWELKYTGRSPSPVVGQIRCILGESLKMICNHHNLPGQRACKIHVDICGQLAAAESLCFRWCIQGTTMSREDHMELSTSLEADWRRHVAPS